MGHSLAKIKMYNPKDESKCLELELLKVDTGSTYTWVNYNKLEKLGIKPIGKWKV